MDSEKMLLVLDLDGTLICSYLTYEEDEDDDFRFFIEPNEHYSTQKRPHLDEFLSFCFANFRVGFWSASKESYVNAVLTNILKPEWKPVFVWSNKKCVRRRFNDGLTMSKLVLIKDLKKVWRRRSRHFFKQKTLILDDNPLTYCRNYGNAIPIVEFRGSNHDQHLLAVMELLKHLLDVDDVRTVDKTVY